MRDNKSVLRLGVKAAVTIGLAATAVLMPATAVAAPAAGCSAFMSSAVSGGYEVTLRCTGLRVSFIKGLGTTLTDASAEAHGLAQIAIGGGKTCSAFMYGTVPGGYQVTLTCSGSGLVAGVGSTLSDASKAARLSL